MKKIEEHTPEELGKILAHETVSITDIYFNSDEVELDRINWAWLHMGFIAGIKLSGFPEGKIDKVLEETHRVLKDIEGRMAKELEKK